MRVAIFAKSGAAIRMWRWIMMMALLDVFLWKPGTGGCSQERGGARGFISFNHSTPCLPQVNNQMRRMRNMGKISKKYIPRQVPIELWNCPHSYAVFTRVNLMHLLDLRILVTLAVLMAGDYLCILISIDQFSVVPDLKGPPRFKAYHLLFNSWIEEFCN